METREMMKALGASQMTEFECLRSLNTELVAALQEYQRLVAYLQRTTNPEEWATHGDWKKLQAGASAALARAQSGGAA